MNEILETLYYVLLNKVLGGRLLYFVYGVTTFLLFYHWSFNKLLKRNISFIKASIIILVVLIVSQSLYYLMEYPFRSPSVRSYDFYIYITNLFRLTIVFVLYTMLEIFFLRNGNSVINKFRTVFVFICFGLYYTPFALIARSENYNFDFSLFIDVAFDSAIATLCYTFIRSIFKRQLNKETEVKMENLILREQVANNQYELLYAKVNPHFLYNSLNSIAGLALYDGEKTKRMTLALSRFFKYSINRELQNIVTIREEIEMIETYLEIEKIRFEERLQYDISVTPEAIDFKIPRFLLQPAVENSVKHGQNISDHTLNIKIDISSKDKKLIISVMDNGRPFDENMKPGFGLKSVYDRLDLFCKDKYEVLLINSPKKSLNIVINLS